MKKIIAFDFGGVLDVDKSHLIRDDNLVFQCLAQIDVDKAFRLFNFVIKHNANVFCISDISRYVNLWDTVTRSILNSKKEEHQNAARYIKDNKREIRRLEISFDSKEKQCKINEAKKLYPDSIIIAFEDAKKLDNCNHIWISRSKGLTEENIKEASVLFE